MASAPVAPRSVAAAFWPPAGPVAASACPPDAISESAMCSAPATPAWFTRLIQRRQFKAVSAGSRVHTELFSLQVLRRPASAGDDAAPRFGITVTKKTGNAVERNRMRRRLRHALRETAIAARPGHDYVVVARRPILSAAFDQLAGELSRALARGQDRSKSRRMPRPELTHGAKDGEPSG
jgi:ribonuclease P protein component